MPNLANKHLSKSKTRDFAIFLDQSIQIVSSPQPPLNPSLSGRDRVNAKKTVQETIQRLDELNTKACALLDKGITDDAIVWYTMKITAELLELAAVTPDYLQKRSLGINSQIDLIAIRFKKNRKIAIK